MGAVRRYGCSVGECHDEAFALEGPFNQAPDASTAQVDVARRSLENQLPSRLPMSLQTNFSLLNAGVPALADDDVVMHRYSERRSDVDDRAGHLDIRTRRRWIAGGAVQAFV